MNRFLDLLEGFLGPSISLEILAQERSHANEYTDVALILNIGVQQLLLKLRIVMHFAILNRLCAGLILLDHPSQFLLRLQALLKLRLLLLQFFLDLSPFYLQPLEPCCELTVLLFDHRVPIPPFQGLIA